MWNINIIREKGEISSDYLLPLADWGVNCPIYIAAMVSFGNHDDINYFIVGKPIEESNVDEVIKYCRINILKPKYVDYGDTSPLANLKLSREDINYLIETLSKRYYAIPPNEIPMINSSHTTFWQKIIDYTNESHSMDSKYHPDCKYNPLPLSLPIPDYTKLLG